MSDDPATPAAAAATTATERARELYLDDANTYGCAETAFVVLKEAFGLPDPQDSAAAMALNGGIAYSGSTCGAITGAALAVGQLAASRIEDHAVAKRVARAITADLVAAFETAFGATTCRTLTGVDLSTEAGHRAFIESGAWRDGCMRQVEMAVAAVAPLADDAAWRTRAGDEPRATPPQP
jgi:C_GCAxxG_C_C family probable redox protein